jgi:hypothetical protein
MPFKYDEYHSAQDHALGPGFENIIAFFQNLELGQTVLDVATRLLGMLLVALSVQFILEGFFAFPAANGGTV